MRLISRYKLVIAVVLPILILVLIRTFGGNQFRSNAQRWAAPSVIQSNLIMSEQISKLPGEKLIINLDKEKRGTSQMTRDALYIPADSILLKNNLNSIRNHSGPILLSATELAVSARIWMLLSQMGYRNIFILTADSENELFKSKFRQDSIVEPELNAL